MNVKLDQWVVRIGSGDLYLAPEKAGIRLQGLVTGHPNFDDGNRVTTSLVQEVNGRIITTISRDYELGEPDPDYILWCEEIGKPIDKDNPIKVIE